MNLLSINSTDFSAFVDQKTYLMQKTPVFEEWEDGNWKTHRVVARTRIVGSFLLTFTTETDFDSFMSAVNSVITSDGYVPVTVFVNTTKAAENINAFIDMEVMHRWTMPGFGQTPEIGVITVELTEV